MSPEARFASGRCWHFLWILTLLLSSLAATAKGSLCTERCKCVRFIGSAGTEQVEIECNNLGLTRVPDLSEFTTNLTKLILENNNITHVNVSDFAGLMKLNTLSLAGNKIRTIEDQSFSRTNLPVLEHLILANNQLETLPDSAFNSANLQMLDLSFNRFTSPPKAIGNTTIIRTHLILSHNPFKYLEEDAFSGIEQTDSGPTDLDLSHCNLTGFHPEAFENFGGLVDLHLDGNKFQTLTPEMFQHVTPSLQRLFLRDCGIQDIHGRTFVNFGRLEELYLRGNNLTVLPRNVFRWLDLKILDLSNCHINNILRRSLRTRVMKLLRLDGNNISVIHNRDFLELEGVQELVLSNSNITEIVGNPFVNFTDLGELYLNNNQLDDDNVTGAISSRNLSRLYFLDLSHNRLEQVPTLNAARFPLMRDLILVGNKIRSLKRSHLENMTTLNILNVKDNGLQEIEPDAFEELPNLTVLNIDNSNIAELSSIQPLQKLQSLHVSHSNLQSLPDDLCDHNSQLTILQATNNDIMKIPPLTGCSRLFSVALSFNDIENLEDDQFAHLPFLEEISLAANKLESLPENAFANLTSLRGVFLQRNRIESFPVGIFAQSKQLTRLNMGFNKIRELSEKTFHDHINLETVDLNNNLISRIHRNAFRKDMVLRHLNISSNDISTWELPEGGFPYLRTLSMQNMFRLHQAPKPSEIRRIQVLEFTYSYHCCIWRDFVHKNDTVIPSDDETPTEQTVTVNPTDVVPVTLPPDIIHTFDEDPFVAECINHPDNPITDQIRDHVLRVAEQFQLTVIILDNCKVEFLNEDGTPLGTDDDYFFEDAQEELFVRIPVIPPFEEIRCIPLPNPLTPCQNLMDPWFLRVAIWAVWVLAVLGNGTVLFVMIIAREKIDAPQFFICNLAFADFCLGVYLTFLAVVDVRTYGDRSFYQSALNWQLGPGCQTAGFLAVFSSELSVFILGGLTLERVHTIASTFIKERMRMRAAVIVVIIGWIFAATLAILPLVGVNSYTQVAVCLPFVTEHFRDKLYIGLILTINLFTFLIILISYIYIFCSIRRSPAANQDRKEIFTAACKIAILIIATFACWFPLATIAYAALADNSLVDAGQAKYFIVFVYPLNACINPFVYAIFTRNFRDKLWSFCRRKKQGPALNHLHIQRSRDLPMAALHSPSGNTTAEDLMRMRQSRRAFSVQLVDRNPVKSPTPPILAIPGSRTGRRSSLPAILGHASLCAAHEQHVHSQSRRGSATSITSATSAVASGATTPSYPLPFRLGPMYSHLNRSLPELVEEEEIELEAVRERLEVAISESHASSDSAIRRLSVVREESESDLRLGAEDGSDKVTAEEADNVSVISANSEDFSDAQDSLESTPFPDVSNALVTPTEAASSSRVQLRQSPPPHVISTSSLHEVSVSPLEEHTECNGYASPAELDSYSPAASHSPLSSHSSPQSSPRKMRIQCTNPLARLSSLEGNCGCDTSHSPVHNHHNHKDKKKRSKTEPPSSVSSNSNSHQNVQNPVPRYVLLSSTVGSRGKMIGSETDV